MTAPVSSTAAGGAVWQTRLSQEAAAAYETDLKILGIDRSEALRRGLRLLHREALATRMAREVEDFYRGERAPLSEVTAAAYKELAATGEARAQPSRPS